MNYESFGCVQVDTVCNGTMTGVTEVDDQIKDERTMEVKSNIGMYSYTAPNLAHGLNGRVVCFVNDALGVKKANVSDSFGKEVFVNFYQWLIMIIHATYLNFLVTNHVTDVTAFIGEDGSICVECSFINGSNALGCEVEFRDRITDECLPCIRYTISKLSNFLFALKCFNHISQGNFSVVAYDKVSNHTSDIRAAVYNELQEYLLVPVDNFYFKTSPLVPSTSMNTVKGMLCKILAFWFHIV